MQNKDISLFSPHDVPRLYDAFGTPEFDALYEQYEADESVPRKLFLHKNYSIVIEREIRDRSYLYHEH